MLHSLLAILACTISIFTSSPAGAIDNLSEKVPEKVPTKLTEGPLVIAYGVSVSSILLSSMSKYTSSTGEKAIALREQGLSSDSIVIALNLGRAELGISGNPWESIEKIFTQKKLVLKKQKSFRHFSLGSDSIVFVVFPGGPTKLSTEQLNGIFTGKIRNWKEVGGDDIPVQIVLPDNTPATQQTISEELLNGEDFYRKGVRIAVDFQDVIATVGATSGAIGFASSTIDFGKLAVLKNVAVKREITAITLGDPSPRVEKFLKILKEALKVSEKKAAKDLGVP